MRRLLTVLTLFVVVASSCGDAPPGAAISANHVPSTTAAPGAGPAGDTQVQGVTEEPADEVSSAMLPPVSVMCRTFDAEGSAYPFEQGDRVCFFDNSLCEDHPERIVYVTVTRTSVVEEPALPRIAIALTCQQYLADYGERSHLEVGKNAG